LSYGGLGFTLKEYTELSLERKIFYLQTLKKQKDLEERKMEEAKSKIRK